MADLVRSLRERVTVLCTQNRRKFFSRKITVPLLTQYRTFFISPLELSKLDKVVEKPIKNMNAQEHWAVFFRYLTGKAKRGKINTIIECEEGIAMASEVLFESLV